MQEFGLLSTLELLCATFAIKSSLLEEDLGLTKAALGGGVLLDCVDSLGLGAEVRCAGALGGVLLGSRSVRSGWILTCLTRSTA